MLLPGWFGGGSGLQAAVDAVGLSEVRRAVREWPFLRSLIEDMEVMLARADLDIAAHYAELHRAAPQGDGAAAIPYLPQVRAEYELTRRWLLEIKEQTELLDGDRTQQRALALRNPYVDPMNLMQVDLLRRWRSGGREDQELLEALLASVNGIAQGLQNTG
jgi:phosphoenolpyruvate carboxylase